MSEQVSKTRFSKGFYVGSFVGVFALLAVLSVFCTPQKVVKARDVSQAGVSGKELAAHATNGQVKGTLVDALNGEPLSEVTLGLFLIPGVPASSVMSIAQTGPKSYHVLIRDGKFVRLETQMNTQTDSFGGFLFENVPAGTYLILPVTSVVDAMSESPQAVIKKKLTVPLELPGGQVLNLGNVGVLRR